MVAASILRLMIAFMVICTPSQAAEVIAHRGASKDAPENTLAAFRTAWEQGADAIELDIHLTRDGRIVVIHDANTRRTTEADLTIAETTFTELRALDAGSWKGTKWKGERIPSLDEVLASIPAGKRVFIEVKCGATILPELKRVIAASGLPAERITLIGFGHEVMKAAKHMLPQIEVCWITRPGKNGKATPTAAELIATARAAGFDGLDLDRSFAIDAAFATAFRAAGLKLYVWTVDKPAEAKRLREAGVHGITSNVPTLIRPKPGLGFRFAPADAFFAKRGVSSVLDLFRTQPGLRKMPAVESDGPFLTAD